MPSVVHDQCGLAHGARIGTDAAGRAPKCETATGIQLQFAEPIAGPALGRQRERGCRAGGRTRHGRTGNARLGRRIETGCACRKTAIRRHFHQSVRRTRVDARTAPGTCGQKSHLRKRTWRPEIAPGNDALFGLRDETLEPVAQCRAEKTTSSEFGWRQHAA